MTQLAAFPAVNTITIGGATMPGQWILQPCSKQFGWQIQQGYGLTGATVFPKGDELVVAPFLVRIWLEADYLAYKLARSTYLKKAVFSPGGAGFAAFALGINHPELNDLGVSSVVVLESPALTNAGGKGLWTGVVKFLQYRAPIPALPKPSATIPSANAPAPTAVDAQDRQIQALSAQIAAARGP